MRTRNKPIPESQIPEWVYVGLHADWYYGFEGMKTRAIRDNGFVPGQRTLLSGRRDSVYVATTYQRALAYANLYGKPLVLKISTAGLDKTRFFYDPMDAVPSGHDAVQFEYRDNIPPSAICFM